MFLLSSLCSAAEIRLRAQSTVDGPVVKLCDVAEIVAADRQKADALGAIELFPAPPASQQRFVRIRELQDLLLLRGVNLVEHQFSGPSQATVTSNNSPARPEVPSTWSASASKRTNRRVSEAIVKHLRDSVSASRPWTVHVELSESQARPLADPARAVTVRGGKSPWTGSQRFEVIASGAPSEPVLVDVQVTVPAAVVATVRSLPRGTVIHADDLELQNDGLDDASGGFHTIEEVVGRETTRAVAAGKIVSQDSLRAPLLVRRGEVVTVYALGSGIRIRTNARAREDGSQGDLVSVDSLLNRKTYLARVSGVREVEVYARAPRSETSESVPSDLTVRR